MSTTALTINHRLFKEKELFRFSQEKLADYCTPPWEKEIFRFILALLDPSDSIEQYSSGTTGRSKKLNLLKRSMMHSAMNTCRYFGLGKGQSALLCLPMEYIAGKMMVVRSMVAGLDLQLAEPKSRLDLNGFPAIEFCAMVPLQLLNLLKDAAHFPRIRKILVGGAEISLLLENQLAHVPAEVYASFGMAETCSHIALRCLNGPGRQPDYHALPGVNLGQDERGCLVISADYLPARVVTNDLVQFTGPGSFTWLGRYDNLINSGGMKIVPEEVEAKVMALTGLECAVIGLPDDRLGNKLAFVFEKDTLTDPTVDLRSMQETMLPRHWKPKEIITVERFPRNNAFKISRKRLSAIIQKHGN